MEVILLSIFHRAININYRGNFHIVKFSYFYFSLRELRDRRSSWRSANLLIASKRSSTSCRPSTTGNSCCDWILSINSPFHWLALIFLAWVPIGWFKPVFRIRIRIHRIHMFLGLPDPDPLVRGMDPDPDPSIIKQKNSKKNFDSYCFVTSFGHFIFGKLCKCTFKK